jgi:hemerythrin-like domain-containing protein
MKATDILYEEHRIIMKVLQCLQKIVGEAEESGRLNADSANIAVDFFRNFADGCHHAKEEDRLFVIMQERGIPKEGGPIGVMLMEHDHGRRYVRGMSQAVTAASQGNRQALERFAENARDLMALLQGHIDKEDQVLFPMAEQVLDESAAEALLTDFRKIESAAGNRHHHFIKIAKQLCDRFDIPFVEDSQLQTLKSEFFGNSF